MLDRDTHLLKRQHGATTEVARAIGSHEIEVRTRVDGPWWRGRIGAEVGKIEVLDLGRGKEGVTGQSSPFERAAQSVTRAALERREIQVEDVAKDSRDRFFVSVPRNELEGVGVG